MRDFLVIGAGSAGSTLAGELARRQCGSVMVLEAGPSDVHPLVKMPMGLVWLMGGARDWAYQTTPQGAANGRAVPVPRGRMVGGSGSINSMVWFRGRRDDFDNWRVPGWRAKDLDQAFAAVERRLRPVRMAHAHPLTKGLEGVFAETEPTPERESAGICRHNMDRRRRRSAATAFLKRNPHVQVRTGSQVDRLIWSGDRAVGVCLLDGSEVRATKGVVLAAGSVSSAAILMRSGVGAQDALQRLGIPCRIDRPEIGANLHDHPAVGIHYAGPGSGYGLEPAQWPAWAMAPFRYLITRDGPFASPTVEGAAFFNARGEKAAPDVQSHFIPFFLAHEGSRYQRAAGYFADVCLCRPRSRGQLTLASSDPRVPPNIDLGLLRDPGDMATLVAGVQRLRVLMERAGFGHRRAPEVFPGHDVTGPALENYIRARVATAYHPVGTLRMGEESDAPVTGRLALRGADALWVCDASIMPRVTSANTNAPSMMIGWKGAEFIAEDHT